MQPDVTIVTNQKILSNYFTCTRIHSVLLDEALSCLTPAEKTFILIFVPLVLYRKSQFKIWSKRPSAAVQTLTSDTAASDSIITFVTLIAASRAQQ